MSIRNSLAMEQPMFYQGQRVVCVSSSRHGDKGSRNPLIEGKSYYVSDPNSIIDEGKVYISLAGLGESKCFWQNDFVPYDTDQQLENEIHEALKGQKTLTN